MRSDRKACIVLAEVLRCPFGQLLGLTQSANGKTCESHPDSWRSGLGFRPCPIPLIQNVPDTPFLPARTKAHFFGIYRGYQCKIAGSEMDSSDSAMGTRKNPYRFGP